MLASLRFEQGPQKMTLVVRRLGADAAPSVHAVVRAAFAARPVLDPPADALGETPDTIAAALSAGGGLLATLEGRPVGAVLMASYAGTVWLRRFGVFRFVCRVPCI